MSVTQAVQRQRFSVSESSESGGLVLDVDVSGRTGSFDIEAEIRAAGVGGVQQTLRDAAGGAFSGSNMEIKVRPSGVSSLRGRVNRVPRTVSSRVGVPSSLIRSRIPSRTELPDASDFRFTQDVSFGERLPISFNFGRIRFPPIVLPDAANLPDFGIVSITVSLEATGFFSWITRPLPSVTVEIPQEAFVSTISVSSFGECDELYPNIERNLDRIEQGLINIDELEQGVRELENIKNNIEDTVRGKSIRDISPQDLSGTAQRALDSWKQAAKQINPEPVAGGQSLSSMSSLENQVERRLESGEISAPCLREFQGRYGTLRGRLGRFNELSSRASNLKEQVLNALEGGIFDSFTSCVDQTFESDVGGGTISGRDIQREIDNVQNRISSNPEIALNDIIGVIADIQRIPSGECRDEFMSQARSVRSRAQSELQSGVGILDCEDVPRYIKNIVAGAESEANALATSRGVTLTPHRMSNIQSTIENARDEVEDEVSDNNPCKDQLLGRLDFADSRIQNISVDPEDLSCEARFGSLDNRLTSLEEDAINIDPPVSAQQFELFAARAERIVDDIENDIPEDDRCRRQFVRRADGVVNRVGRVGARARIVTELSDEEIEEREQIIDELRDRLQTAGGRRRRGRGILDI